VRLRASRGESLRGTAKRAMPCMLWSNHVVSSPWFTNGIMLLILMLGQQSLRFTLFPSPLGCCVCGWPCFWAHVGKSEKSWMKCYEQKDTKAEWYQMISLGIQNHNFFEPPMNCQFSSPVFGFEDQRGAAWCGSWHGGRPRDAGRAGMAQRGQCLLRGHFPVSCWKTSPPKDGELLRNYEPYHIVIK